MTIKAKPVLKDKFWIVENNGERIGTMSWDERYMFSGKKETVFFNSLNQLKQHFGNFVFDNKTETEDRIRIGAENEVYGFPTNCVPYQPVYDIKRKLPLFSKSNKSKSYYCAGYYIVKFNKGWVKSFCPKLITVERYETQGPFKTDIEMKQALSKANGKT